MSKRFAVFDFKYPDFFRNGSNGSTDSAGIFFQKRPDKFSTDRPRQENNNKSPVTREDSTIYAEIDEAMVMHFLIISSFHSKESTYK